MAAYIIERLGRNGKRLDYYAGTAEHGPRFALAESSAFRFTDEGELVAVVDQLRAGDQRCQFVTRPAP